MSQCLVVLKLSEFKLNCIKCTMIKVKEFCCSYLFNVSTRWHFIDIYFSWPQSRNTSWQPPLVNNWWKKQKQLWCQQSVILQVLTELVVTDWMWLKAPEACYLRVLMQMLQMLRGLRGEQVLVCSSLQATNLFKIPEKSENSKQVNFNVWFASPALKLVSVRLCITFRTTSNSWTLTLFLPLKLSKVVVCCW